VNAELNNTISNYDWDDILSIDCIHLAVATFTKHLYAIFEANIPHFDMRMKPKDLPWFSYRIKRAINKLDNYTKSYIEKQ
jgi:hypothetical protein